MQLTFKILRTEDRRWLQTVAGSESFHGEQVEVGLSSKSATIRGKTAAMTDDDGSSPKPAAEFVARRRAALFEKLNETAAGRPTCASP